MKLASCSLTAILFLTSATAPRAQTEESIFITPRLVPQARKMIGTPLLDWAVSFNNRTGIILHRLLPEGVYFADTGNKQPNESVDDLRKRAGFVIFAATCPGSSGLQGKISSVNIWETISNPRENGAGLQQALEAMSNPPSVQTPSVLRAPSSKQLKGPVFEYTRGDTAESLSFVNEQSVGLRLSYFISNPAVCPK